MQKIKDKSKKIKVIHLQTISNFFCKVDFFMIVFDNVLSILSFQNFYFIRT